MGWIARGRDMEKALATNREIAIDRGETRSPQRGGRSSPSDIVAIERERHDSALLYDTRMSLRCDAAQDHRSTLGTAPARALTMKTRLALALSSLLLFAACAAPTN